MSRPAGGQARHPGSALEGDVGQGEKIVEAVVVERNGCFQTLFRGQAKAVMD